MAIWSVLVVLAMAALIFIALVVLWLGVASRGVFTQGADGVVIRAVMRADVDNVGAELLAERMRDKEPNLELEIITETIGRSLLALQEPWIAEMPDFAVTPLPVLVEFRHPLLLKNPASVQSFVDQLQREPEVDFVAYNETAHNRLVSLAHAIGDVERHTWRWLMAAVSLAGLPLLVLFFSPLRAMSWGILTGLAVACWAGAWVLAWPVFRYWEAGVVTPQQWNHLPVRYFIVMAGVSLIISFTALIIARGIPWRR